MSWDANRVANNIVDSLKTNVNPLIGHVDYGGATAEQELRDIWEYIMTEVGIEIKDQVRIALQAADIPVNPGTFAAPATGFTIGPGTFKVNVGGTDYNVTGTGNITGSSAITGQGQSAAVDLDGRLD